MLIYSQQNINSDMAAPISDAPATVTGAFGVLALTDKVVYTALVTPRTAAAMGYTFELAYYPELDFLPGSQRMWGWSMEDREVIALPGGANPAEAQRLGTRYFLIMVPAGQTFGYVRLSDIAGGGVDLAIWRGVRP